MTVALALPALRALDPVTLEEVVAAADRQVRIDRKYVLPQRAVDGILTAAAETDGVRALEIGGEREFDYASLYFDTPDLLCFHAAGQGRRRRFKVRTRDYLDSGESWLEVKVRGPRGTTVKERMPSAPGLRRLTGEAAAFVTDRLTAHGIEPAATLFFDDSPRNVEGARAVGWNAELYVSTEKLRADLRRHGLME